MSGRIRHISKFPTRILMSLFAICAACFGLVNIHGRVQAQDAVGLPLIRHATPLFRLLAVPEQMKGKRVLVTGYARVEFEGNALFYSRDDRADREDVNAIGLSGLPREVTQHPDNYDGRRVYLEGTFEPTDPDEITPYVGYIGHITEFKVDPPPFVRPQKPRRKGQ